MSRHKLEEISKEWHASLAMEECRRATQWLADCHLHTAAGYTYTFVGGLVP